jgi:hypothetical protein
MKKSQLHFYLFKVTLILKNVNQNQRLHYSDAKNVKRLGENLDDPKNKNPYKMES